MENRKRKTALKILVATDGSDYSKAAVEEVASRLFLPKTQVRIISVIDKVNLSRNIGSMGVLNEYYVEAEQNAIKSAKHAIEYASNILHKKNPKLTVTTAVLEGSPKSVILEEAEKFGADLIVVGSHGNGVVKRFLLGSVSHAVSLHAKCSVEIVRK